MKLDFLEPVVAHKGPWATVYAGTGPSDESSAERRELTWRELCRSLEEQGADEATVSAVRDTLAGRDPGAAEPGIALFATEGRTVLTRGLGQPPPTTQAVWSEVPRLTPLLELAQQRPTCLVARVDRVGADIEAARMDHAARAAESVLDRFRAGRDATGGDPAAIEGVHAVAEAAREHRIDTLLITPAGPEPRQELWIGERPDQVAVRRSDAEQLGAEHPHTGRADDALLCSAAATGGEAFVLPGDAGDGTPAGGIGALLRWPVTEAERTRG